MPRWGPGHKRVKACGHAFDVYKRKIIKKVSCNLLYGFCVYMHMEALSHWVKFDPSNVETYPDVYGKYLICRKDGKIHWETWNGSGWAYNESVIVFWAVIVPPVI